jgi:hypothetical protein
VSASEQELIDKLFSISHKWLKAGDNIPSDENWTETDKDFSEQLIDAIREHDNSKLAKERAKIASEIEDYADFNHPKHIFFLPCKRCDLTAAYRVASKIVRSHK